MAYGLYKYVQARNLDNFEIRILKKDYVGSSERWLGWAEEGTFKHRYGTIDAENIWETPVQKSTLEVYFVIENSTQFNLLQTMFEEDEDEYRMQKVVGGTVVWTGKLLPGRLDYQEGSYPKMGTFIAKDMAHLEGEDFALEDNRELIITTIAKLLPFDLDIYTYTSWTGGSLLATDDYLRQLYHDTIVCRDLDDSNDLDSEPWTKYKTLTEICKAHKLILRQSDNAWHLFQLSELAARPSASRRVHYNSSGVKQGATSYPSMWDDVDQVAKWVLPSSRNSHKEGVKQNGLIYEHQSGSSSFSFPTIPGYTYPGGAVDTRSSNYFLGSQPFTGNGDEKIRFYARVDPNFSITSGQDTDFAVNIGNHFMRPDGSWNDDYTDQTTQSGFEWQGTAINSAINTTNGNITVTVSSTEEKEKFKEGTAVRVRDISGLPAEFAENTTYYLIDVTLGVGAFFDCKLSATPGGAAIVPATAPGTIGVVFVGINMDLFRSAGVSTGNIADFYTDDIPDAAEGDLTVYLPAFTWGDFGDVYWFSVALQIENPTVTGQATEYRLKQTGVFSIVKDLDDPPKIYWGDGPHSYSRSSFRTSTTLGDITLPFGWHRRLETQEFWGHHEINLKEELSLRRKGRRVLEAQLYGSYEPHRLIRHRGQYLFMLEGQQTGFDNLWDAEFFQLKLETD